MFNANDIIEVPDRKGNVIAINRNYVTKFEELSDGTTGIMLTHGELITRWSYKRVKAAICGYVYEDSKRVQEELPKLETKLASLWEKASGF